MTESFSSSNERLTVLWVKAQPVVWAYIQSVVWDYHHAEDVLQQVAQQSAASFDQYDSQQPFTAWVVGIAKNKVREHCRRQSRDKLVFSDRALEAIGDSFARQGDALAGYRQALRWCLSQLGDKARQLLDMRYAANLKPAAIAECCHSNANAIRIRLHRYRTLLAECIAEQLAEEELA